MTGYWYIACFSRQLGSRPLARRLLGQDLVLFRQANGQVAALQDRCAHRHLALSRGQVTPAGLQCAYHGWTYDAAGVCTVIPAACEPGCPFNGRAMVRAYAVRELQGLIQVYLPPPDQPTAPPHGEPVLYPHLDEARWSHWFMERVFDGDAFQCVENFLDVPHTSHVHRGWFRHPRRYPTELEISTGADWVQCQFVSERPMDTVLGRVLFRQDGPLHHVDRFRLPYITSAEYRVHERRQYLVMSQCTPIDATRTRVFTFVGYRVDGWNWLVGSIFRPMAQYILGQDLKVIAEQSADLRRTGPPRYVYHPTDAMAREIRDLLDGQDLSQRPAYRKKLAF